MDDAYWVNYSSAVEGASNKSNRPKIFRSLASVALLPCMAGGAMQYSATICPDRLRSDIATSIDVLLLSDSPRKVSEVRSAIEGTATTLTCTSTVEAALSSLSREHFDLIIVDRHLGGWLTPQACKALVLKAEPTPVVGLINDKCVLELRDGIEAGLLGVYYTDQIDARLMQRLSSRYAHLPSLRMAPNEARGATA